MRWAGHIARMGRGEVALVGKIVERKSLGRPGRRWYNNIDMDLREVRWGVDRIYLAQNRNRWRAVMNSVMDRLVP
jgi:hypothetical protein